jgi:hypothetical protein
MLSLRLGPARKIDPREEIMRRCDFIAACLAAAVVGLWASYACAQEFTAIRRRNQGEIGGIFAQAK